MSGQQLLLSWKDHNGSLVAVFDNLLQKSTLVDCTLAAEGQYLKAHKVVLSACSSYFELLFSQESERNPIVILKDVKFQELQAAVVFMYKGEVEVSEERLPAFLEVADALQIKGLGNDGRALNSRQKNSIKSSNGSVKLPPADELTAGSGNASEESYECDGEQLSDKENCAQQHLSQNEGSASEGDSTASQKSRSGQRLTAKDTARPSDPTCGEALPTDETPLIKTEPEDDSGQDEKPEHGDDGNEMEEDEDWENASGDAANEHSSKPFATNDSWLENNERPNFAAAYIKEEPTSSSWGEQKYMDNQSVTSSASSSNGADSNESSDSDDSQHHMKRLSKRRRRDSSSDVKIPTDPLTKSKVSKDLLLEAHTSPPNSFTCPKCFKSFTRFVDLKMHMTYHEKESLKCPYCEYVASYPSTLSKHIHNHKRKGSQSKKIHKCKECGFQAKLSYLLRRHSRIHTEDKPLKCKYCSYATAERTNLTAHLRVHTGEKPYQCSQCSAKFARLYSLKRHIMTIHEDSNDESS